MNQREKCIVQINAVYGKGSTGNIVSDIHNFLTKEGYKSYVFTPDNILLKNNCSQIKKIGNKIDYLIHAILWRILQNQGWNSYISTLKFCKQLKTISPDIVHLHNLHSNYIHLGILLRFLAKEKVTVVLTMHDCWFFTGNCFHFLKYNNCQKWISNCVDCSKYKTNLYKTITNSLFTYKKKLFKNLTKLAIIGVSEWITSCSKKSSVLSEANYFQTIYNWVDTEIFKPRNSLEKVKKRYDLDNKKIILGVSQGWSEDKGLNEFKKLSQRLSEEAIIILVGDPGRQKSTKNIKFIGYTANIYELAELYAAADVFVNPSKMETFGKVTAEALSSGVPVVCYANTGMIELVDDKVGKCVENGSIEMLLLETENVLKIGKNNYKNICRKRALEMFDKNKQLEKYIKFYEKITGGLEI